MEQFNDNLRHLQEDFNLIGRDEEIKEILYRVASGNMLLIEGEKGIGKTALLKHVIENFGGRGKVIYLDVGTFGKRFDVNKLINKNSRGMILLVDNIQYLSEQNNKKIKYFYDQDNIKSVIFTVTNQNLVHFTDAIRSRIGRNIIKLKKLDKNSSMEIIQERLEDKEMLPKDVLEKLYKDSKNIKEFLINCNALCGYLRENNIEKAKLKDIDKIVKNQINIDVETCLECNKKLVKIGQHWRCEHCDKFCHECGALYDEEDSNCPRCGLKIKEDKK